MSQMFILNNPNDARQALCKVVCAYMDFYEYWLKLTNLEERYDESIEQYDLETWLTGLSVYNEVSSKGQKTGLDEANSLLRETTNSFSSLLSNSREGCKSTLQSILQLPQEIASAALGFSVSIPSVKLDAFLRFFFGYLEDEGMDFDDKELYADDVEIVDIFKSIEVKFQRFLQVLEQVQAMDVSDKDTRYTQ